MSLTCESINVLQLKFRTNDVMTQYSSDLPLEITPEYGVDEDGDYHLAITVEMGKKDSKRYPFYLNCKVGGLFSIDDDLMIEDPEQVLLDEGVEIVMSFVRSYIYRLTQDGGIDPVILPRLELEQ